MPKGVFLMKNIIKVLGIITCMVVISFSMIGCGDPEEEKEEEKAVGTITVINTSNLANDIQPAGVTVYLYQGNTLIATETGLQTTATQPNDVATNAGMTISFAKTKTSAVFADVEEGDNYAIWVLDVGTTVDTTPNTTKTTTPISIAKGDKLTFNYSGYKIEKQ